MTKDEFLQFLRDPDVCKEIFEIVKKGGKPTQPQQKFSSIADKLKFVYGQGDAAPKQPQPVTPKVQSSPQPVAAPKVQSSPQSVTTPKVQQPSQPSQAAPKNSLSLADKLKLLRGHLDKVREEEQIAATKVEEKTPAEKYTVITNRKCPICEKDTRVIKPKTRLNVEKRDVDYCVHYKDFDPYLYTVFACEHCGFAAEEKKFAGAWPNKLKETLREFLKQNDMKLPFVEERNADDALSLFEMAILFSELTDQSKGRQAILNLNAAWLCRCENFPDREREFLQQAAENFSTALNDERWPINGITDDMATYLCAAIYYLLKEYDMATQWLGRTMNNANLRTTAPKLFEQARDMWQDIKRANKA